ncbi:hypothetical protein, partial [Alkalibacillus haloalkaliphilus]|uniref:hypothetical protein n=1 Tax=Alkalibacillus haloalkaliphilus TaxID=94136 RepID=UPI0029355188
QNLGNTDIILGLDWLKKYNPAIDWENRTVEFDPKTKPGCMTNLERLLKTRTIEGHNLKVFTIKTKENPKSEKEDPMKTFRETYKTELQKIR